MLDIDEATDHNATAVRLRYLEPGVPLRLAVLRDVLGGFACSIVEADGRTIWIDLPIRRDAMLDLEVGQLVSVRFDRPGDAVYSFDTVVTDLRPDDRAPFGLAMPVTIDRRARRNDARVPLVLDAHFEVDGGLSGLAKVVDLSAGGVGLICEEELTEGAVLTVRCALPGPDGEVPIEQRAEVRTVSMYGRTPGGTTLHHYGVAFTGGDDELREQILTSVIWNLTHNPAVL
ncbi:flagellar brake protein [Acidimicrobiia bacterium EGI L10123]|uniref:PilZ domain-containing protein n=1 Tax=Salinilacustrithrix flava TaxID=2957203 RepID=UPI003D7C2E50|nr:flagellar brake protein [Acidimicrobiia bacterium EGI L10123]